MTLDPSVAGGALELPEALCRRPRLVIDDRQADQGDCETAEEPKLKAPPAFETQQSPLAADVSDGGDSERSNRRGTADDNCNDTQLMHRLTHIAAPTVDPHAGPLPATSTHRSSSTAPCVDKRQARHSRTSVREADAGFQDGLLDVVDRRWRLNGLSMVIFDSEENARAAGTGNDEVAEARTAAADGRPRRQRPRR